MTDPYPKDLRYTKTHEWVRLEDNHTVTVGITHHAQYMLGDLVFVELPDLNKQTNSGEEVAVVESVKTAADVYSPVRGSIIGVNKALQQTPGAINADPYGSGWLFRLKISDAKEIGNLLDAQKYQSLIESQN